MINPDEILSAIDRIPSLQKETERGYIGASEIGHPCDMYLWLKFHRYIKKEEFNPDDFDFDDPSEAKAEETKARMRRIFQRGHDEELRFEGYLHAIGAQFKSGSLDQSGFTDGFFSGHTDGEIFIFDEDAISEYKTHNRKSFDKLKRGQLEKTHTRHYAQAMTYMKYFKKSQSVYLAVCKDSDRIFCDVIQYDEDVANKYSDRAEFISMSDKPPEKISKKPTFYLCRMCSAKEICFGFELPSVNCRNCTSHVKVQKFGAFRCEMIEKSNDLDARSSNNQLDERGWCEHHSFNPYAMNDLQGWEPVEFYPKQRAVAFKKPDGTSFINGKSPFGVESKELEI
jgi:hypothetical protein